MTYEDTFVSVGLPPRAGTIRFPAHLPSTTDTSEERFHGRHLIKIGFRDRAPDPRQILGVLRDFQDGGWGKDNPKVNTFASDDKNFSGWHIMATEAFVASAAQLFADVGLTSLLSTLTETLTPYEDPMGPGTPFPIKEEINVTLQITDIGPLEYSHIEY